MQRILRIGTTGGQLENFENEDVPIPSSPAGLVSPLPPSHRSVRLADGCKRKGLPQGLFRESLTVEREGPEELTLQLRAYSPPHEEGRTRHQEKWREASFARSASAIARSLKEWSGRGGRSHAKSRNAFLN